MGFSNQERINQNSKALAAKVLDANEIAQWYETRFPFGFVSNARQVWTQFPLLQANPASSLAVARTNVSGALVGTVLDVSQFGDATQLTAVAGTNNSTYVAYQTFDDASSGIFDNWVQPQQIPQTNGAASIGYAVALYDGDPNTSGTLVTTTDGTTGTGASKSVGWIWDYSNGLLFLSADFRNTLTNPDLWVLGFRYIGTTAQDAASSGSLDNEAEYVVNSLTSSLPNAFTLVTGSGVTLSSSQSPNTITIGVNQDFVRSMFVFQEEPTPERDGVTTTFSIANTPQTSASLMLYINGVLQSQGPDCDYTLSGTTIEIAYAPRSGANMYAHYPRNV